VAKPSTSHRSNANAADCAGLSTPRPLRPSFASKSRNLAETNRQVATTTRAAFYDNESDLRAIWSDPLTRIELLTRLEEAGFATADLRKIQDLIAATDSDLYDVLAFISFDAPRLTRQQRADHARTKVAGEVDDKARDFIEFVLSHYVNQGFEELWLNRLGPLLEPRHDSLHEGLAAIGMGVSDAREVFVSFQKHLYELSST